MRLIAPAVSGRDDSGPVQVVRLERLGDLTEVTRALRADDPVVVDLHRLDQVTRRRAFDVVAGIAYALDATMCRIDERARFLLTPACIRTK